MNAARGSILVVDDEESLRRLVVRKLEKAGFQTVAVTNGCEALEAVRQCTFDLMLLDVMMPGMSGMDVLEIVSAEQPGLVVIMLTAMCDEKTVSKAFNLGAHDFIPKPFSLAELVDEVGAVIEAQGDGTYG